MEISKITLPDGNTYELKDETARAAGTLSLPVSVANGGTGATDAATARTNLGAVNKAGDTMTGALNTTSARVYAATPYLQFSAADNITTPLGGVLENLTSRRVIVRQVGTNGYPEDYYLPANSNPTSNQTYVLYSTKQLRFSLSGSTLTITNS